MCARFFSLQSIAGFGENLFNTRRRDFFNKAVLMIYESGISTSETVGTELIYLLQFTGPNLQLLPYVHISDLSWYHLQSFVGLEHVLKYTIIKLGELKAYRSG